jgi:hypothetical protein
MEDDTAELLDVLTATRQALKGLQRQARQTLQLATDLEERLAERESALRQPTANGGTRYEPYETKHHTSA